MHVNVGMHQAVAPARNCAIRVSCAAISTEARSLWQPIDRPAALPGRTAFDDAADLALTCRQGRACHSYLSRAPIALQQPNLPKCCSKALHTSLTMHSAAHCILQRVTLTRAAAGATAISMHTINKYAPYLSSLPFTYCNLSAICWSHTSNVADHCLPNLIGHAGLAPLWAPARLLSSTDVAVYAYMQNSRQGLRASVVAAGASALIRHRWCGWVLKP